jgi:hypothetical protein
MPAEFRRLGVAFQYPENWTLDVQDALAGRRAVTVYSPGGGFWAVSVHPRSANPHSLAKAAVKAMQEEYEDLENCEVSQLVSGHQLVGYDLNFFYLDLTNTALIRCIRTARATYAVFCQAEDREFDRVHAVFDAMTTSLLSNLPPPEASR